MASIFKCSRDGQATVSEFFRKEELAPPKFHTVYSAPLTRVKVETPDTRKVTFEVRTTDHEITYRGLGI